MADSSAFWAFLHLDPSCFGSAGEFEDAGLIRALLLRSAALLRQVANSAPPYMTPACDDIRDLLGSAKGVPEIDHMRLSERRNDLLKRTARELIYGRTTETPRLGGLLAVAVVDEPRLVLGAAHLILASYWLDEDEKTKSAHATAWRALRYLAMGHRSDRTVIAQLPSQEVATGAYALSLEDHPEHRLRQLGVFLNYACGYKDPPRRRKVLSRHHGASEEQREQDESLDPWLRDELAMTQQVSWSITGVAGEVDGSEVRQISPFGPADRESDREAGGHPCDPADRHEIFVDDDPSPDDVLDAARRSVRSAARAARGRARHMAMAHQTFDVGWNRFTGWETEEVLRLITERAKDPDGVGLAGLLAMLFWYGRPLQEILSTVRYDGPLPPPILPALTTNPDDGRPMVVIRAGPPVAANIRGLRMPVALPCPDPAVDALRSLRDNVPAGAPVFGIRLWTSLGVSTTEPLTEKALDGWLAAALPYLSPRLTTDLLSRQAMHVITNTAGGGTVLGSFLTGRPHPLGTVPSWYAAHSPEYLARVFATAWNRAIPGSVPPATIPVTGAPGFVGSPFRPGLDEVSRLSIHLRGMVEAARLRPGAEGLAALHNALTLYVATALVFEVATRGVNDGGLAPTDVASDFGWAAIRDKDYSDGYHTRHVPLTPALQAVLTAYWKHLEALSMRLVFADAGMAVRLTRTLDRARWSPTRPVRLFFLTPDLREQPFTQADFKARLSAQGFGNLKTNAGRHHLRSSLVEQGVPEEAVDAFLGHWQRGTEPFGPWSGLRPLRYRERIAQALAAMQGDLWPALDGLGA